MPWSTSLWCWIDLVRFLGPSIIIRQSFKIDNQVPIHISGQDIILHFQFFSSVWYALIINLKEFFSDLFNLHVQLSKYSIFSISKYILLQQQRNIQVFLWSDSEEFKSFLYNHSALSSLYFSFDVLMLNAFIQMSIEWILKAEEKKKGKRSVRRKNYDEYR